MSFLPSRSSEWQRINKNEDMKAINAELQQLTADIVAHTLRYNPLNPDESLDAIYQIAKRVQRELQKQNKLLLEEWTEAIAQAKGHNLSDEEIADIRLLNDILRTKEMGDSTIRGGRGRWRKRSKTNH